MPCKNMYIQKKYKEVKKKHLLVTGEPEGRKNHQ
jgi:hypothetical protein